MILPVQGKVGKEVKEPGDDNAFVAASDEDEGRSVILSVAQFNKQIEW